MEKLTRKQLIDKLEIYLNQNVIFKVAGLIEMKTIFEKFEYRVEYDVMYIKSGKNKEDYIALNFNDINFMGYEKDKIILHVSDRTRYDN